MRTKDLVRNGCLLVQVVTLGTAMVTGAGCAAYGAPPQPGYQVGGGWDVPPSEYNDDLRRRAFHDGIEAARRDFGMHLPPNPETHETFRHPQVPFEARETYREAYKRGYFLATQHLRGGGPPVGGPPPVAGYAPGGWDAPPSEYNDDVRRQAFHAGIEAARRDFAEHRPLDPAAHEEFRHPQVPYPARESFREAFRRGYLIAAQHMGGGPR